MTIYEIKRLTAETSPYFFSKSTLQFFGQTMRSFKIKKQADGRYMISAPIKTWCYTARQVIVIGETIRYFNPSTNELDYK